MVRINIIERRNNFFIIIDEDHSKTKLFFKFLKISDRVLSLSLENQNFILFLLADTLNQIPNIFKVVVFALYFPF